MSGLERRFRTRETPVRIAGHEVRLLHPADAEALIDETDFARDERLPYWADVWPSAQVLAQLVGRMEGAGRTLLDLGCGAGLVATAAALAGFAVTASDYYADAILFAQENVRRHAGTEAAALPLDWRQLPDTLARFDVVVASDVLYERPYGALVAGALARTLAPAGQAWLTDPGRVAAASFVEAARGEGLEVHTADRVSLDTGAVRPQTIDVYAIRWRRGTAAGG